MEIVTHLPIAYMDPGTGSLFLQILLGGVAGAAVFLKLFWQRILAILGMQKKQPVNENVNSDELQGSGDHGQV